MTLRYSLLVLLLGALILSACGSVGENYQLQRGETLSADQHLAGVDVELESGSTVEGDLNITASKVEINNRIQGDLTVVASDLIINDEAVIEGDLIYCIVRGGEFNQSDKAVIWGSIRNSCDKDAERQVVSRTANRSESPFLWLGGAIFFSLAASLFASLSVIFFPHRVTRISLAAHEHRFTAMGLGFFTLVVAIGLSFFYTFSLFLIVPILLAPVVVIIWIALFILIALGIVSVAQPFGAWILRLMRVNDHLPIVTAMLGAGTLTFLILIVNVIAPLSIFSISIGLAVISWALGAALLTRGGNLPYSGARV